MKTFARRQRRRLRESPGDNLRRHVTFRRSRICENPGEVMWNTPESYDFGYHMALLVGRSLPCHHRSSRTRPGGEVELVDKLAGRHIVVGGSLRHQAAEDPRHLLGQFAKPLRISRPLAGAGAQLK